MEYLMFVCVDPEIEGRVTVADGRALATAAASWQDEMNRRGLRLHGGRLRPASEAATIRLRGDRSISPGPFTRTREQIIGYSVLDCASLEEAIDVAARHPVARIGAIEVRAFAT